MCNIEYPYFNIAYKDGVLFTKWGPCFCPSDESWECPACKNAEDLEAQGLDYDEEYEKAAQEKEDRK